MNKLRKAALFGLGVLVSASAGADITIRAPKEFKGREINTKIAVIPVENAMSRESAASFPTTITLNGQESQAVDNKGFTPCVYTFMLGDNGTRFYAAADEPIVVTISDDNTMTVSGSPLMDGIEALNGQLQKFYTAYGQAREAGDEAAMQKAAEDYDATLISYIATNPGNPVAVWAVMQLDGQALLDNVKMLEPSAKNTILYPLLENAIERTQRTVEAEAKQKAMSDGHIMAPDFTLNDIQGKAVSLSDFRGKWVIVDFWGSWCGWCIKGFPNLKEAYAQYEGKLEIIGVDCGDTPDRWRAAVKKYSLPWVNVYNAESDAVEQLYGVQGFPTKIIVDPDGHVYKIVVGEDPAFYDYLREAIQ